MKKFNLWFLSRQILPLGVAMYGRMLHSLSGEKRPLFYEQEGPVRFDNIIDKPSHHDQLLWIKLNLSNIIWEISVCVGMGMDHLHPLQSMHSFHPAFGQGCND